MADIHVPHVCTLQVWGNAHTGRREGSGCDSGQELDLVVTTMERESPQGGNKGWQALVDIT